MTMEEKLNAKIAKNQAEIVEAQQAITEMDLANIETEQALTDMDLRLIELEVAHV